MNREELSKHLFCRLSIVEPYPELVAPIPNMIDITAFFPGGSGLWKDENSEVFPTVLVLGQDFSTEQHYHKMLRTGKNDIDGPTWRNMRKLFYQAELNLFDCFFSNVFMGLRKTESMTGKFPGARDKAYVNRCIDFLLLQVRTIEPIIIITLGKHPSEMLSKVSKDLGCWKNNKALTVAENGLKNACIEGHTCKCIALEHPSMRSINVHRRRYKGIIGNEAEIAMLRDALNGELIAHR